MDVKSLVIFYSLEGNTRLIAETIAQTINADILELKTKKTYSDKGFKKYFWCGKSVILKEKPELIYEDKNIDKYKNIALFACHGGGGAKKFYDSIRDIIPNNKFIGEIDFVDPLKNNKVEYIEKVAQWVNGLIM